MERALMIALILGVLTLTFSIATKVVPCPEQCSCHHSKHKGAECYGLSYIPRFPQKIISVSMRNGKLHLMTNATFYNLTFNSIYTLRLVTNDIRKISSGAFNSLQYLKILEISNETLLSSAVVCDALKNANRGQIERISFNYNMWSTFPDNLIRLFPNILRVRLKGNRLESVKWHELSRLFKLRDLDLSNNIIRELPGQNSYYPSLVSLVVVQNRIEKIPEWCNYRNYSRFPKLKTLKLDSNILDQTGVFRCLPNLRRLSLGNNRVLKLTSLSFTDLKALEVLYLTSMGQHLDILTHGIFNISSLKELFIRSTGVQLMGAVNSWFTQKPNLRTIDISDNFLPSADGNDILKELLFPLVHLKSLFLERLGILHIPVDFFSRFVSIEVISLRQNKIVSFTDGSTLFRGLKSLKRLDLFGNRISFIGKHSFSKEMIKSLKEINLSGNPYNCNCALLWFIDWTKKETQNRFLDRFPRHYLCSEPVNMRFKMITSYNPTKTECFPWNPMYTAVISISFAVLLFMIFVALVLRCKPTIKNYVYLMKLRYRERQGYRHIKNSNNYQYHAFVVYCDSDRQWVHTDLLSKLENEEGFHLCVHQRDFEPGETITCNVDNFLKKSWKVIVVLSNEFTKSEWCQWEVDVVQERRRRMGKDVVVPIMIENVNSNHMTSQMCTLLDSTPFLRYKKGQENDIFWKCVVESLRKPIGSPPVAEL